MSKEFSLRSCQLPMVEHIFKHPRCAIFSPMGTGKTSGVLATLDDLELTEDLYPILIVAPKRVAKDTWPDEVKKWTRFKNLTVSAIVGNAVARKGALRKKAQIYTANYESLPWLVEELGVGWKFKTIIADEMTRLKSFRLRQGSSRARALGKVAFLSPRFIGLTATPSSNGLQDLWGQIYFLDKGQRLGKSFEAFKQRWFQLGYDGFSIKPLPGAQEEIQNRIKDICLYIDAKDYFDIKEPIVNKIYVKLPPKAMKLYKEMERHMFVEIEREGIEAFNAASKTGKCLQLANGAIYYDDKQNWKEVHDAKLEALEDIMEECNGNPLIVAYNFISDKERILQRFKQAVDLSTDKGMRQFRDGSKTLGVAHPASLGHGVDGLQDVTNIMVFFGHDWNLELFDQLVGRIGPVRQMQSGHDRPVFLHHIIAQGTMDEMVMERRESKRSVQDILLAAMKKH